MAALGAYECVVRRGLLGARAARRLSGTSKLLAQAAHRHPVLLRSVEPRLLLLVRQRDELGVVAPREVLPASGDLEARRDPRHVHQRLRVVAGDPRRARVALAVAGVPEPHPVADPPSDGSPGRAEPATVTDPVLEREPFPALP